MASEREKILEQIRAGRQMVVGGGGNNIRPAGDPKATGAPIKAHTWGM